MSDAERSKPCLALVIREADRELIQWTRQHRKLALRVFPDDRALGPADRELASNIVILMRTGEELEPPIMEAFVVETSFALEAGTDLPPGYPRVVKRDDYWTASLQELPDSPAWSVLTQDVEARVEELLEITPADTPPVIWLAGAVSREKRLSMQPWDPTGA